MTVLPDTSCTGCLAKADAIVKEHSHPLDDKPLVDVSTDEDRNPDYVKLQTTLLSLFPEQQGDHCAEERAFRHH